VASSHSNALAIQTRPTWTVVSCWTTFQLNASLGGNCAAHAPWKKIAAMVPAVPRNQPITSNRLVRRSFAPAGHSNDTKAAPPRKSATPR
jgi:hypothetical protein